ncbi:MAG: alpha/beta fold hydrolase [Nocardioidaceae bacterium]
MSELDVRYSRTGSGEPLVLIHGIGHRRQAWDPVVPILAEHRDVIAVDLPGFGESPALPAGMSYDMETTLDNFAKVFAELGLDRPHVAGNSLGGAIALELGARDLVASVTALSPAGFWTTAERSYAVALLTSTRVSAMVPDAALRRMSRMPRLRRRLLSPIFAHPERFTAEQVLDDARALRDGVAFRPTAAAGLRYHCRAVPTVPTTVGWGSRDHVLLARQADIARRRLPDATHVSLPGCGHVPMIDDPELVAAVLLQGSTA